MISYIFKSKIKNTLVAIILAILILINLNVLHNYFMLGSFSGVVESFLKLIPYVLIFLYIVTLKREYKIKQWLFPIAFAFLTFFAILSMRSSINEYTFMSINGLIPSLISLSVRIVMILGYVFCFVGTLSNFKRLIFLRLGLAICTITNLILGSAYYYLTDWIGNEFFSTVSFLNKIFNATILLLFYISIFFLTLTKKSEYIDITPFIERRRIKKEIKKSKRLARENPEEFSPPLVPDGHWRCMGCGEILPDNKTECECGYKK